MAMVQLEQHLRAQREDIAKRQFLSQERMVKRASELQKSLSTLNAAKKAKSVKKGDRTEQLNGLRDWIEEQIQIEDKNIPSPSAAEQTLEGHAPSPPLGGKSTSKGRQNPNSVAHALPGNNLLPLQDEQKLGIRQNRYGLEGDNGYSDIVKDQRKKDGLATMSDHNDGNVLDFTQPERHGKK